MTNDELRKELMSAVEAAELLKVTKRTILKWARAGKIERVKISRRVVLFTAEAVDNFLKARTNGVESAGTDHRRAGRKASPAKETKRGGGAKHSGESWRDLRQEVSSWES